MAKPKKDTRLFARLDLDYADHPKIEALSDAAFRAHVSMILYSRKYLTDGRIPNRVANRFGSESLAELLSNDVENPSLVRLENGDYLLHGFVDMQETKAEVERRSAVNRANGARGGRKSGGESVAESVSELEPIRVAETETETETTTPNGVVPRKRGSRIPEPFLVTKEMRAWAAEEVPGLDVDGSTRAFVDYWRAAAGRGATKLDWIATWRNWLRRDFERMPGARPSRAMQGAQLALAIEAEEQMGRRQIGA